MPPSHQTLSNIGRIFYGIAIAALGIGTIVFHQLPYMMIPPKPHWFSDHVIWIYLWGALLLLAGICIVFEQKRRLVSAVLAGVLLGIFFFYYIPYEVIVSPGYKQFGDWENAAKELSLAAGALMLAGRRLIPLGIALYALTIISYSIDHFLYAHEAAGYVPAWVPNHVLCLYLTGAALFCSGLAILINVKRRLAATLLGIMILSWVIVLHIPYAIAGRNEGEITSLFLALAYCGIAFMSAQINSVRA